MEISIERRTLKQIAREIADIDISSLTFAERKIATLLEEEMYLEKEDKGSYSVYRVVK